MITLQISNFVWTTGGMNSIEFGPYQQIRNQREISLACELFAFGLILIMAVYHLVLFALRTQNKAPLYFGIFCLLLALRVMLVDEVFLLDIFPWINWYGYVRMLYLSFYLGSADIDAVGVFSVRRIIFPENARFVLSAGVIWSLIVLAAPPKIFDMTLLSYEILSVIWLIYVLYILIRAVRRRLEGARLFIAGFLVLFLTAINDMLASLGYLDKDSLVKFGLLFFIFSQSVILSKKFSRAFQDVERLSEKLIVFDKFKDEFLANTSRAANPAERNYRDRRIAD
ncbi:7TM-DISM domain-containing protein [Ferviditalea candida]|uniref:7TM-DISM domain-containing protein n=1 Tax=Ferviditalea candida TaxID=3108399 RepID=A0ABU5ZI97_9BACL|nr:7TM-DISM domain-containing protein [Paenibacillaceae bacterium T2]